MALYILEDKSLHPFLSKRTSQEISAVKSLNQRRIPTRSITDISDLSVLLSDSESIFLIPYSIGEDTLPAVEFCNLNGIPVIAIGVPTIVDSSTLVYDALSQAGIENIPPELEKILENGRSFFVSLKESDEATKTLSKLIGDMIGIVFGTHFD